VTAGLFLNTDINTEADDYFPDINNLFDDMALNGDNINANSNTCFSFGPCYLLLIVLCFGFFFSILFGHAAT
jgi:hypothetical protein